MKKAFDEGKLYREQPFIIALEEKDNILVQGIIDAYFFEDGEIVVVDYKTDQVKRKETLIERYKEQVELYKKSLEQITGVKVKEMYLYSIALQREVKM